MKRNVFKKRYCPDCKCLMELADTLGKDDPYVGYYEVKGAYKVCLVCKKKYLNVELVLKQLDEFKKIASGLLLKNYPPDKYEYLSENEAFQTQRKKITDKDDLLYKDEDLLRHLRYFIFNMVWEGKRIYLKKSFDIYQDNFTGWFDITKPADETTL